MRRSTRNAITLVADIGARFSAKSQPTRCFSSVARDPKEPISKVANSAGEEVETGKRCIPPEATVRDAWDVVRYDPDSLYASGDRAVFEPFEQYPTVSFGFGEQCPEYSITLADAIREGGWLSTYCARFGDLPSDDQLWPAISLRCRGKGRLLAVAYYGSKRTYWVKPSDARNAFLDMVHTEETAVRDRKGRAGVLRVQSDPTFIDLSVMSADGVASTQSFFFHQLVNEQGEDHASASALIANCERLRYRVWAYLVFAAEDWSTTNTNTRV
jgi:hypothetical protein